MKNKSRHTIILLSFIYLVIISGCKDYHSEMIKWSDEIPVGSDISVVKNNQPDFIKIDWENPLIIDSVITWYYITEIKGHSDFLKMEYFLEFEKNKYRGQFAQK